MTDRLHPPLRRERRWRWRLLALAIGCVLASLLTELLVLVVGGEQPKFPRHVVGAPWGLRYNEPGSHYRHKSADMTAWFKINGQGMRADRDYDHAKPTGVRRVLALGDSFTIGYEVAVEDSFASVIEARLRRANQKVEVLNAGVSGFGTSEELLYLERELYKYEPDLVVIGFTPNDMGDNIRSGLLRLDGDRLVQASEDYVPAGSVGDFLNRNGFVNLLGERSNAFVALKEGSTILFKSWMLQRQELAVIGGDASAAVATDSDAMSQQLAGAIFERLYDFLQDRRIPLVIISIPAYVRDSDAEMIDLFPMDRFDVKRPGIDYVSAKQLLDPFLGKEKLRWTRSHKHWTPFSHRIVAEHTAALITSEGLLQQHN